MHSIARVQAKPPAERLTPPRSTETSSDDNRVPKGLQAVRNASHPPGGASARSSLALATAGASVHGGRIRMERSAYEAAIRACCKANQPAEARRLFDELRSLGRTHPHLVPTTSTWNNLLYAHANRDTADPAQVERLCDAMSRAGVARDASTWGAVIKAHANAHDAALAVQRLEDMRAAGFAPDLEAFMLAMGALARSGRAEEADRLFSSLARDGIEPDRGLWHLRMKAHAKAADVKGVRDILRDLQQPGTALQPDAETFNLLITAHLKAGDVPAVREVFERMKASGPRTAPNLETCKLVLTAMAQAGDRDSAVALFREMPASGLEPDVVAYCQVINACAAVGDNTGAIDLLRKMQAPASRARPDLGVYNTTIKACANAGDLEGALALLGELRQPESSIQPDLISYTSAIHACAKARDAAQAMQLFEEMQARHIRLDAAAYTALANAQANGSRAAEAANLSREMETQTGVAEAHVTQVVLKGFMNARDPEGAERWFRGVWRRHAETRLDFPAWALVIDAYGKAGRPADARRLLEEALQAGAVRPEAGFRAGQLDFHLGAVSPRRATTGMHDKCVSTSMALALMAHHRDKGNLTPTTAYVVGHHGGDRIKTAVLDALRDQGLVYEAEPGNPGRLVPAARRVDWWDETN